MSDDLYNIEAALGCIGDGPFPKLTNVDPTPVASINPKTGVLDSEHGLKVSRKDRESKTGRIQGANHYLNQIHSEIWKTKKADFERLWENGKLEEAYSFLRSVRDQMKAKKNAASNT